MRTKALSARVKPIPAAGSWGQPAMSVAIELQAERAPSRHAQIDQAQLGVDEVEVIMQAFAAVRPQEGAMRAFVVPGLVAVTGFHRRDDMHQAGIVATHGKNLGDEVLLADMALGNMFDGHASSTGQFASPVADAIAERFSKSRIVEDADLPRRQKCRHSLRITGPWQRAGDDDAVVAGEHPGEALTVTIRQQLPQPSLRLPRLLRLSYPVWFRLGRLRAVLEVLRSWFDLVQSSSREGDALPCKKFRASPPWRSNRFWLLGQKPLSLARSNYFQPPDHAAASRGSQSAFSCSLLDCVTRDFANIDARVDQACTVLHDGQEIKPAVTGSVIEV